MSDSILASLVLSLDAVVFERMPEGVFMELTPPPEWFSQAFSGASRGNAITLAQALPFLEVFLTDAEAFWWERRSGIVRSGAFTVQHSGEELLLRASAINVHQRPLLLIERLVGTADPRDVLQKARERSIEHERVAQALERIRAPLDALVRAVNALAAAELPPAQRTLVDEVARNATRIQGVFTPK